MIIRHGIIIILLRNDCAPAHRNVRLLSRRGEHYRAYPLISNVPRNKSRPLEMARCACRASRCMCMYMSLRAGYCTVINRFCFESLSRYHRLSLPSPRNALQKLLNIIETAVRIDYILAKTRSRFNDLVDPFLSFFSSYFFETEKSPRERFFRSTTGNLGDRGVEKRVLSKYNAKFRETNQDGSRESERKRRRLIC